jgi:hypothetical protein
MAQIAITIARNIEMRGSPKISEGILEVTILMDDDPEDQCNSNHLAVRMSFPQTNNGVFALGRDVNIHWKHGINAPPPSEQDGKGRISIIFWRLAKNAIEEVGSPLLLGSD